MQEHEEKIADLQEEHAAASGQAVHKEENLKSELEAVKREKNVEMQVYIHFYFIFLEIVIGTNNIIDEGMKLRPASQYLNS